jgi:catechol 2,3-dioxygenase-like lactoylglutathione lyase family enzyme
VGQLKRIAPIFAVRDLDTALAHYQRLGFTTRAYEGGGYGYATRDGIEIHVGVLPDDDCRTSGAYLFVEDANELAAMWRSAGVEVRTPEDTEWGQHEGAVVDPDGNVIRFGSPMMPIALVSLALFYFTATSLIGRLQGNSARATHTRWSHLASDQARDLSRRLTQ